MHRAAGPIADPMAGTRVEVRTGRRQLGSRGSSRLLLLGPTDSGRPGVDLTVIERKRD